MGSFLTQSFKIIFLIRKLLFKLQNRYIWQTIKKKFNAKKNKDGCLQNGNKKNKGVNLLSKNDDEMH